MKGEMKKFFYLLLAVVSTMLLIAGSARAAEKFDTLQHGKITPTSDTVMDGPGMPCIGGEDEQPQ
jgi:hypothetical protein